MDILDIAFNNFKNNASRLEIRSQYKIDDTNEYNEFQKYINGEKISGFANKDWLESIENWVSNGKIIERIRVIPTEKSLYCDYEFNWCYPENIKAGETINFIDQSTYKKIADKYGINEEFWLFDNETVIVLRYSDIGEYIDSYKVNSIDTTKYILFYNELKKAIQQ